MYLKSILDINGVLVAETTINFQFAYNDNIIQMQKSAINFTGNARGKYKNKRTTSCNDVDNQHLPKRENK